LAPTRSDTFSPFLSGAYIEKGDSPRADPTIVSYNASPVKIYKANLSAYIARFEIKNIYFDFEKR
jgi:hypothetical protein